MNKKTRDECPWFLYEDKCTSHFDKTLLLTNT